MKNIKVAIKSEFYSFKSRLFIGCSAIFLFAIAAAAWKIATDYKAAVETTVSQTHNLVLAIEAHIVSDIDKMKAPLDALVTTMMMRKAGGMLTPSEVKAILTSPLVPSTSNYWFTFINADGIGVASSRELSVMGVSFNDRDYFNAQKNQSNDRIFIGEPSIGIVSLTKNYYISKRVEDAQGGFLGVIVAVVDTTPLVKVLEQFLYNESLSINVATKLGKIIARVPLFEESFGMDISKSNLFLNSAISPSGTYRGISTVDKKLRIYSYRAFERYPLTISVGMLSPFLIDIVLDNALKVIAGLLSLLLVLILGSKFALNSFRNLELFAKRQQVLNNKLDASRMEIEASERRARMIADNMPALVSYIDCNQRYQFRNSHYRHTPGIDFEHMLGRTILEVFGPERYAVLEKKIAQALKGESIVFESEITEKDGTIVCLRYQLSPDISDDGAVAGFYALVSDVTDMKIIQHQLMQLSRTDSLTGLPNRTALYERLADALTRTARRNHVSTSPVIIGCLFLDIDSFKSINDSYGHSCGDAILKEFGARLVACVRKSDMVARLAGDEFVILLEELEEPDGVISVAKKIITAMTVPFVTQSGQIAVTASIGITVSSNRNETPENLLKNADNALYEAKRNGRNTFAV